MESRELRAEETAGRLTLSLPPRHTPVPRRVLPAAGAMARFIVPSVVTSPHSATQRSEEPGVCEHARVRVPRAYTRCAGHTTELAETGPASRAQGGIIVPYRGAFRLCRCRQRALGRPRTVALNEPGRMAADGHAKTRSGTAQRSSSPVRTCLVSDAKISSLTPVVCAGRCLTRTRPSGRKVFSG